MSTGAPRERLVGQPVARREDARLLTGGGEFVDDIPAVDALHVAFVRSPHARARVISVDGAAARALPGVQCVLDAGMLGLGPLHPAIVVPGSWSPSRPLLAAGEVRFAGEAVVAVAAASPYLAEDAAERVEVEYEPLDALVDPRVATGAGAPELHAGHSNALYDVTFDSGGVDPAFAAAAIVIEREFRHPRLCASPIETRGVLAEPVGDGVQIWSSSQVPHALAEVAASLLGLPASAVRVRSPDIGGAFGVKAHVYPEEIVVAALALRLGRPVKWIEDRAENLLAASHARDQIVTVRAAAAADGRLLAFDADILCDTGAYGVYPHGHILEALGTPGMLQGPYRLPQLRYRARSVATNKAPEGAYRGVGLPVSAFVHERLMDILAGELGLDRAEIRRRNLIAAAELPLTTHTGQLYDSGDYVAALELALAAIDYPSFAQRRERARREGRLIGLGISCYVEYTGVNRNVYQGRGMVGIPGVDSAHLALGEDGGVAVWTTLPAIGQGTETTFAQVVADELGLELEQVRVERPDTAVGPLVGTGTFASRSAILGSGALLDSTRVLRERMLEDAAARLEASVEDLRLRDGAVHVAGAPQVQVTASELLAGADPERYRISARFDSAAVAYPYATHACEVEVDPETAAVTITRYVIAEDCGRVINPQIVEGQIAGATAQGIGGALLESLVYSEDGQLITGSFMDYLLPTAAELPPLEIHHLQTPAPGNPTGAKGVGEGGTLAPPGALAGAVSHALSAEFNELPLLPARVAERLPGAGEPARASR
ncbi:MAG TPA: xanthine dehydrogenase family protein molybdopterin-binding subunit [Solirubrobacteraceae bacterium]|nr:xanthine dehydrogenase family protein molybdopterin-binding subunit [Solirubrobacteraceae bacterium]